MKVSQIMRKANTVDENITVKDAAKIMSKNNVGCVIITKGNSVKGIITERDVMKNISKLNKKVKEIMPKKILTVNQEDEVESAVKLIRENEVKRIPVISNKKIVGIITITDILAHSTSEKVELEDDFFLN